MSVNQKTLHSAMQGAPGEDAREFEERQRRATIAHQLSREEIVNPYYNLYENYLKKYTAD